MNANTWVDKKVITPSCTGLFFPSSQAALQAQVAGLLQNAVPYPCHPKAIIVPHAGYGYSGPVAAAGYACLAGRSHTIRQVVLLGTCHVVRTSALLTTTADAYLTPLGYVPVDTDAVERAMRLPKVSCNDEAHTADHAVAVQLPFLQSVLEDFVVVPFLVGDCTIAETAEVQELLWNGDSTLLVVSSDLSHYLTYEEACRRDQHTASAILRCECDALGGRDACGYQAIAGLLTAAKRHHLRASQIDLRNSGDTLGDRNRVVGYGAFVFEPELPQ